MREFTGIEYDDLRVVKSHVSPDRVSPTTIEYQITNNGDFPKSIRLVEEIPQGVSTDDVELSIENSDVFWTKRTDEPVLTFEAEITPGESLTTHLSIEAEVSEDKKLIAEAPEVECFPSRTTVESSLAERVNKSPDSSGEKRSETEEDHFDFSTKSNTDKMEQSDSLPNKPADTLVASLVEELSSGRVEDTQLTALRDHLEIESTESQSIQQQYLRSQVMELAAYSEEFERFLDEVGRPLDVVESLEKRIERINHRMSETEREIDSLRHQWREHEKKFGNVEAELAQFTHLEEDIDNVKSDLQNLMDWIDIVDNRFEERDRNIQKQITELREWRQQVIAAVGSLERGNIQEK